MTQTASLQLLACGAILVLCTFALNIAIYLSDGTKAAEHHLQTDRERQLEQKLVGIMRQLQRQTVKATDELKKVQDEHRQAVKRQELRENECSQEAEHTEMFMHRADNAQHKIDEFQQWARNAEDLLVEYHDVCASCLFGGLDTWNFDEVVDLQDAAKDRIETLKHSSATAIKRVSWKREDVPEYEVRLAREREQTKEDELSEIGERERKLVLGVSASVERKSSFEDSCRLSSIRKDKFGLMCGNFNIIGSAIQGFVSQQLMSHALSETETEQATVANRVRDCQEQMDRTSERLKKLEQEISQVDKRQYWLHSLKTTCGDDKQFQHCDDESVVLKQKLQTAVKDEETLLERLQESQTKKKRSAEAVGKAIDGLKITGNKWLAREREDLFARRQVFEQIDRWCEDAKEDKLQRYLREACKKEQRCIDKLESLLSKENQLKKELEVVSDQETPFRVPMKQLSYKESGKFSIHLRYVISVAFNWPINS